MQSEDSKQTSKHTYDREIGKHTTGKRKTSKRLCTELSPLLSTGLPPRKPSAHCLENLDLQKMKISVLKMGREAGMGSDGFDPITGEGEIGKCLRVQGPWV